jgi:hypothetical protein
MILACASPLVARAQQPAARPRVEAQWMGRRAAARQMLSWRFARARTAWRRGHARGAFAARRPVLAARWQRASLARAARGRMFGRFWDRQRVGRMGRRWWL